MQTLFFAHCLVDETSALTLVKCDSTLTVSERMITRLFLYLAT